MLLLYSKPKKALSQAWNGVSGHHLSKLGLFKKYRQGNTYEKSCFSFIANQKKHCPKPGTGCLATTCQNWGFLKSTDRGIPVSGHHLSKLGLFKKYRQGNTYEKSCFSANQKKHCPKPGTGCLATTCQNWGFLKSTDRGIPMRRVASPL